MRTVLVVDVPNLAWKAFHAVRGLSYGGVKTGVVFGLLKQVESMTRSHAASAVVMCFDSKTAKARRQEILPCYKANRTNTGDPDMASARKEMRKELRLLQEDYLPSGGFENVFAADGYEADDVVASVCNNLLGTTWRAVVASSDRDLWQVLNGDSVMQWDGNRMMTAKRLQDEFGLWPASWAEVKALAGCSSDNVPGCRGVGEATAAKWLRLHDKGAGPKTAAKIKAFYNDPDNPFQRNLRVVKLPFPGCPKFTFEPGMPDAKKFSKLMGRLGIKSLGRRRDG